MFVSTVLFQQTAIGKKGHEESVDRWSPPVVVVTALLVAFVLFLSLEIIEQSLFAELTRQQLRAFHFLRGFVATAGGMFFTWMIMRKKEAQLVELRNGVAQTLSIRTEELNEVLHSQEQQRTKLDAILASMAEALIEINEEGLIQSLNDEFERKLGIERKGVIGTTASEFFLQFIASTGETSLAQASLEWNKPRTGTATYEHPNGQHLVFHWACSPIRINAQTLGAVVTLVDLTERCRLQDDLSCQREDFLSVINHRLRTPVLANIRANVLLLEDAFGALTDQQRQLVQAMRDNSEDIDRLLTMLVDIYRYKNNHKQLQKEVHSAKMLIEDSLRRIQPKVQQRNFALSVALPADDLPVKVDKQEFLKLLGHLADNAVKHARSTISISAHLYEEQVHIVVEDDGVGISSEDIPRLFNRFYQVSSSGSYSAVTGTGLCLCAEIARAHDGRLSCSSEPKVGTRFTVTLKTTGSGR